MIVRDAGDSWQIVLQTDHAILAGAFAATWGNEHFDEVRPRQSVIKATLRHDDGWAIWERAPSLLTIDGTQRPRNFLDVGVLAHLAFYRAMIAAVHDDDPYAELLVSMHGAGIYNGRYGTNPELKLTYAEAEQREVKAFVREQEARHSRLIDATQIDDAERWTNYRLLQAFDRLSLYAAMVDLDAGAAHVVGPVPVTYAGETTELQIEPIEPWHVRISPYPFAHNAASFELIRRTVPKRDWKDSDDFRDDFFAADAESERLTVSA